MPRLRVSRNQALAFAVFILSGVAFLYFVLPQISGVTATVRHIGEGDTWWIAVAIVLEVASFGGYVVLFRAVFMRERGPIGWRESYQITMAGLAATRLFAAAGAGGVALTVWALRRSGLAPRHVASRMVTFMALLYVIYPAVVLLDGLGLGLGLLPGGGSFAITIVPAIAAAILLAIGAGVALVPGDIERRLARFAGATATGRLARALSRAAAAPALLAGGVRGGFELIRAREAGLIGAPAWWGFDACVLWACFEAFGHAPPFTVILMAYFVGMLGNLLPLPGGLGGVEGAMIGVLAIFGVEFDLSVLAVLSYRAIAFWLPTAPGAIAYLQLRRTVARWRSEPAAARAGERTPVVL